MNGALLLLLRCLSTEPDICQAAVDAALQQPELAYLVRYAEQTQSETDNNDRLRHFRPIPGKSRGMGHR